MLYKFLHLTGISEFYEGLGIFGTKIQFPAFYHFFPIGFLRDFFLKNIFIPCYARDTVFSFSEKPVVKFHEFSVSPLAEIEMVSYVRSKSEKSSVVEFSSPLSYTVIHIGFPISFSKRSFNFKKVLSLLPFTIFTYSSFPCKTFFKSGTLSLTCPLSEE